MPARTARARAPAPRKHHGGARQTIRETAKDVEINSDSFGWGETMKLGLILVGLFNFDKVAEKHFARSQEKLAKRRGSEATIESDRRGSRDKTKGGRDGDRERARGERDRSSKERERERERERDRRSVRRTRSYDGGRTKEHRESKGYARKSKSW
jgi:hypothetical protein